MLTEKELRNVLKNWKPFIVGTGTAAGSPCSAMAFATLAFFSRAARCMFAQTVGVPLAAYINRRRLDRALSEIGSDRKAVDAALEYGLV